MAWQEGVEKVQGMTSVDSYNEMIVHELPMIMGNTNLTLELEYVDSTTEFVSPTRLKRVIVLK